MVTPISLRSFATLIPCFSRYNATFLSKCLQMTTAIFEQRPPYPCFPFLAPYISELVIYLWPSPITSYDRPPSHHITSYSPPSYRCNRLTSDWTVPLARGIVLFACPFIPLYSFHGFIQLLFFWFSVIIWSIEILNGGSDSSMVFHRISTSVSQ